MRFCHVFSVPTLNFAVLPQILEHNAQIILQINQAMMENRADLMSELMPVLGKNIHYLQSLSEQSSTSMPPPESVSPYLPVRISQSPLPVRPVSQGTPPHISPPPGIGQSTVNGHFPQFPPYSSYGSPAQQHRPQPVYSPLAQSTHAVNQPKSPNLAFQQPSNGLNRPHAFPQGYGQNVAGMGPPVNAQSQQSNSMPPPLNYPYPTQTRGKSGFHQEYGEVMGKFGRCPVQNLRPDRGVGT